MAKLGSLEVVSVFVLKYHTYLGLWPESAEVHCAERPLANIVVGWDFVTCQSNSFVTQHSG